MHSEKLWVVDSVVQLLWFSRSLLSCPSALLWTINTVMARISLMPPRLSSLTEVGSVITMASLPLLFRGLYPDSVIPLPTLVSLPFSIQMNTHVLCLNWRRLSSCHSPQPASESFSPQSTQLKLHFKHKANPASPSSRTGWVDLIQPLCQSSLTVS